MTFAKHYVLIANAEGVHVLGAALSDLAEKVRTINECNGVLVFQDRDTPARFTFIERWSSAEAYKEGASTLGRNAFQAVIENIAVPPEVHSLDSVVAP